MQFLDDQPNCLPTEIHSALDDIDWCFSNILSWILVRGRKSALRVGSARRSLHYADSNGQTIFVPPAIPQTLSAPALLRRPVREPNLWIQLRFEPSTLSFFSLGNHPKELVVLADQRIKGLAGCADHHV